MCGFTRRHQGWILPPLVARQFRTHFSPHSTRKPVMWLDVPLSVRASVRASVRDSRGSFMFPRYLQYLLTDFRQTFVTGASLDRDELFRFWSQKVKVQGDGMTECIPDFHVSTISPVYIDRFSPNCCHWCILGHRWPDYVFGSKGQSSRSHHRGGGAQQLFLVINIQMPKVRWYCPIPAPKPLYVIYRMVLDQSYY